MPPVSLGPDRCLLGRTIKGKGMINTKTIAATGILHHDPRPSVVTIGHRNPSPDLHIDIGVAHILCNFTKLDGHPTPQGMLLPENRDPYAVRMQVSYRRNPWLQLQLCRHSYTIASTSLQLVPAPSIRRRTSCHPLNHQK